MKIIYTIIALLIGTIYSPMRSQFSYDTGRYGKVTPQTADFMKYGEVPVSLYTGKMSLNIPIYTINDRDFNYPISLTYLSDGFKVNKRSGFVGYNWFLNAGGCITREIYGVPDDFDDVRDPSNNANPYVGTWWTTQKKKYTDKDLFYNIKQAIDNNHLIEFGVANDIAFIIPADPPLSKHHQYDLKPDLFSLNINGHKIRFMIGTDGNIVSDNKGYKVNLSNIGHRLFEEKVYEISSEIEVISPDGYKYYFGGDNSSLEFSRSFKPDLDNIGSTPIILAWHITKIIAPNGRSMIFEYIKKDLNSGQPEESSMWTTHITKNYSVSKEDTYHYKNYNFSATRNVILKSIKITEKNSDLAIQSVIFNSELEGDNMLKFYEKKVDFYSTYQGRNFQLSSIVIKHLDSEKYRLNISYEIRNKRRFLSTITQGDGKYEFFYKHPSVEYPISDPNIESNIDEFGYLKYNTSYGLLEKITYPTGGYNIFQYESNDFQYKIVSNMSEITDALETKRIEEEGKIGGSRIKKIESYLKDGTKTQEKEYIYKTSEGLSSGTLLKSRPYFYSAMTGEKIYFINNIWNDNYNIEEPHIGYSEVLEKFNNNSSIKYQFSDVVRNEDKVDAKIYLMKNLDDDRRLSLASGNVSRMTSNYSKRGLLLKKTYYDPSNNISKVETYRYRNIGDAELNEVNDFIYKPEYVIYFSDIIGGAMAKKIYLQSHPLKSKKETKDGVTLETKYLYNDMDLLCRESLFNKGKVYESEDSIVTTYKYSSDKLTKPVGIQQRDLLEKNILNLPVLTQRFRDTSLVSTKEYTYLLERETFPAIKSVKQSIGNAFLEDRIEYKSYDAYGNPINISKDNALNLIYLWSYNGQYPIAEITGMDLSEIEPKILNLFKVSNIDALSSLSIPNEQILRNGELQKMLPNALVTTYTYTPLVGMSSMTNPSGITTYYEYDNAGRLIYEKDNDKNILKKYVYNYHTGVGGNNDKEKTYNPLQLSLVDSPDTYSIRKGNPYRYTFRVNKEGGSDLYSCKWTITNLSGTIVASQEGGFSGDFTPDLSTIGRGIMFLTCEISDGILNTTKEVTKRIEIKYPLIFENIEWTRNGSVKGELVSTEYKKIRLNLETFRDCGTVTCLVKLPGMAPDIYYLESGSNYLEVDIVPGTIQVEIELESYVNYAGQIAKLKVDKEDFLLEWIGKGNGEIEWIGDSLIYPFPY